MPRLFACSATFLLLVPQFTVSTAPMPQQGPAEPAVSGAVGSQPTNPKPQSQTQAQPTSPPLQPAPVAAVVTVDSKHIEFTLEDGTPVRLSLGRDLSSGVDRAGDRVDFKVIDEVKVNGVTVIPKDSIAWGTISQAQPKRRMGRGGKLIVGLDTVRLADGEKVPLRATRESDGGGHVGVMAGAMVATGIVFFPAAPLFLFIQGKDTKIPKGTEVSAYINGDKPLDLSGFETAAKIQPVPMPVIGVATPADSQSPVAAHSKVSQASPDAVSGVTAPAASFETSTGNAPAAAASAAQSAPAPAASAPSKEPPAATPAPAPETNSSAPVTPPAAPPTQLF